MAIITGFFEEIGFFESICKSFEWVDNDLVVSFEKGIDIGGSEHPLSDSLKIEEPCNLIFKDVVQSKLKISTLISQPNNFDVLNIEKEDLPGKKSNIEYSDFYMEGTMRAGEPKGWFTWDVVADSMILDNLKP
jgi:hypothetical protein